jgi:NAD(P)-dependent dehydrogenase (short-subunit alcohol dehydrogenase family)
MRERDFDRMIFIVSNTFWRPPGGHMLAYVASKGALIGMVRTLAVELGGDGVVATAVAPGLARTRPQTSSRRPSSPTSRRTRRFRDRSPPTTPLPW